MCRPNFRPWACTQSASGLKPRPWVEEGKREGTGINRPWSSSRYLRSGSLFPKGLPMYQPSSMTAYVQP